MPSTCDVYATNTDAGHVGFELAKAILKIRADVRIIFTTAFEQLNETLDQFAGLRYKPAILDKPFSLQWLCNDTKRLLEIEC